MWKYCIFCGNWELQEVCSICNEQKFRTEVYSDKLSIYITFNWNSNNTLLLDSVFCAQVPWLVEELQLDINQLVKSIGREGSNLQVDTFSWFELREQITNVIDKLWKKTNRQQNEFLFDIWIGLKVFLLKYRSSKQPWLFVGDVSNAVSQNA